MIVNLVRNGVVEYSIAVNSFDDLVEFYPEHALIEKIGEETIGWVQNPDGTFSPA